MMTVAGMCTRIQAKAPVRRTAHIVRATDNEKLHVKAASVALSASVVLSSAAMPAIAAPQVAMPQEQDSSTAVVLNAGTNAEMIEAPTLRGPVATVSEDKGLFGSVTSLFQSSGDEQTKPAKKAGPTPEERAAAAAEKAEKERIALEVKAEKDRVAKEQRLAREVANKEKAERLNADRKLTAEQAAAKKAEKDRIAGEQRLALQRKNKEKQDRVVADRKIASVEKQLAVTRELNDIVERKKEIRAVNAAKLQAYEEYRRQEVQNAYQLAQERNAANREKVAAQAAEYANTKAAAEAKRKAVAEKTTSQAFLRSQAAANAQGIALKKAKQQYNP
eukprot:GFKZ01001302.1.p1 GENE.GFKZ01001302.1~~GFKZ01001302.1.p1  ORF type:complete len:333 (-),score=72.36 GFKZ01001302.1:360-1358(-)